MSEPEIFEVDVGNECYVTIGNERIKVNGKIPYEVITTLAREHGIKHFVLEYEDGSGYAKKHDFPLTKSVIMKEHDTAAMK